MRKGFTLLEILTVVSILAVTTALLAPALISARGRSKRTHCLLRLKSVGAAALIYASDYDDRLPAALEAWTSFTIEQHPYQRGVPTVMETLRDYTASQLVFHCLSDLGSRHRDTHPHIVRSFFALVGSSYTFPDLPLGLPLARVSTPSETVYARDSNGEWHGTGHAFGELRYNWLLLDGHVRFGKNGGTLIRSWMWSDTP